MLATRALSRDGTDPWERIRYSCLKGRRDGEMAIAKAAKSPVDHSTLTELFYCAGVCLLSNVSLCLLLTCRGLVGDCARAHTHHQAAPTLRRYGDCASSCWRLDPFSVMADAPGAADLWGSAKALGRVQRGGQLEQHCRRVCKYTSRLQQLTASHFLSLRVYCEPSTMQCVWQLMQMWYAPHVCCIISVFDY